MVSIYGIPSNFPLFHAYDNNIIITTPLQINNIINVIQIGIQHIYTLVDFVCFSVYLFIYPFVRSFIMIRNYSTALFGRIDLNYGLGFDFDFYFVGTMFLILLLCYMFKAFYDIVGDAILFENERLDTRIRMSKARIEELVSQNKKLTFKLQALKDEFDYFREHHFNVQIIANKNMERKFNYLKKQIQMYE